MLFDADSVWDAIAEQIRTHGSWANEGGDLVPHLAAALFDVRIHVLYPGGGQEMIGDLSILGTIITLYHPVNHWDATAPLTQLFPQPTTDPLIPDP
jgi:hypothetical protein